MIKRQVFGEYNEKLTFFTDSLGKVIFYSYGSKSPRSSRRALLAYPALLEVVFEKKSNLLKLLELKRIVSLWDEKNQQSGFVKLLPHIDKHLPLNSIDGELFSLLKHFFQLKIIAMEKDFLDLVLLANLLKHLGLIGLDFSCEKCKKLCHQNLIVAQDNSLWGAECYRTSYEQSRQNASSKNSMAAQSPSSNTRLSSAPPKNQLTTAPSLILSVRSIALIKTLVKHPAGTTHIASLYEMYQKNFAAKEAKKNWENAYQYLVRISKAN